MKHKLIFILTLLIILSLTACSTYPKKVEFSASFAEIYTTDTHDPESTYVRFVTGSRIVYETHPYQIIVACTGFTHDTPEVTGTMVNEHFINSVVVDVKTPEELKIWREALVAQKPTIILNYLQK